MSSVFSAIKGDTTQALTTLRNPLTASHRARLADLAARRRIPAIYPDREFVEAGGLMSYGVDVPDLWGRAAVYVDKILKGAKPGNLQVEQPSKFALIVNLKAARTLGLTIPPSVLNRADEVMQ